MKKIIAILALVLGGTMLAKAQNANSSASQTIQLELTDAVEIGFVATGNSTGSVVNMGFNNVNDYSNGVESAEYQMRVRSNVDFDVRMEASSDYFTYSGSTLNPPSMRVKDILDMMVLNNNTGGTITSGYHQYKHINGDDDKKIINQGDRGGNQTFAVKYRATPGFAFPAGTYTTDIIYAVTKH